MAFKSLIRPVYEYGSVLMTASRKALATLASTQHTILTRLLGVRHSTKTERVHAFWGVPKPAYRAHDLAARWLLQARNKPETCLIRKTLEIEPNRKRALQAQIRERGLIQRYEGRPAGTSVVWTTRTMVQEEVARYVPSDEPVHGMSRKARKALGAMIRDRRTQSLIIRWMMRVVIGQPQPCGRCGGIVSKQEHMERCAGITPGTLDRLLKERRFDHAQEIIPPLLLLLTQATG